MRRAAFTAVFTFGFVGFLFGFLGAGVGSGAGDGTTTDAGSTLRPIAIIPAALLAFTALGGYFARGFPTIGGRALTTVLAICAAAAGGGLVALAVSPAFDDGLATIGMPGLTVCVCAATVAWLAFTFASWRERFAAGTRAETRVRDSEK